MADQTPGYNESSVVLPSLFGAPGAAMENAISRKQQDKAFEYQKQKQNEQDEWRKVNLINELTDLSQYQTPDSAANKIGEDRAAEVLQKYTSNIKTMSPADLLGNIKKDMTDVHIGMNSIKTEFTQAHEATAALKQKFPSIDAGRMERDLRAEITGRRLKGDASFVPQMDVDQTPKIDINDPEVLSDYITSDEKLREGVLNPRKEKAGVGVGNINKNIEYGGDIPFYSDVNYKPEQSVGGFIPDFNFKPTYKPKEVPISTDILKGKDGKQLMGVPPEVLAEFSEGERGMQLLAATKKKFPNYKELSSEQKQAAISNTLRERLGDEKALPFITSKRDFAPPRTTVNVSGAGDDAKINKVYERLDKKINENFEKGFGSTRFNSLANDEQDIIKTAVKNAGFVDAYGEAAIGEGGKNIHIVKDSNGKIKIYKVGENRDLSLKPENEIATLSYTGTNFKNQTGKQGKENVLAKEESGRAVTKPPTSNNRPPLSSFGKQK